MKTGTTIAAFISTISRFHHFASGAALPIASFTITSRPARVFGSTDGVRAPLVPHRGTSDPVFWLLSCRSPGDAPVHTLATGKGHRWSDKLLCNDALIQLPRSGIFLQPEEKHLFDYVAYKHRLIDQRTTNKFNE